MQGLWLCCSRMKALPRSPPPPPNKKNIEIYISSTSSISIFLSTFRKYIDVINFIIVFGPGISQPQSNVDFLHFGVEEIQHVVAVQSHDPRQHCWFKKIYRLKELMNPFLLSFFKHCQTLFFVIITLNFVSNAQLVPNICHSIHCKGIQESLSIFLVIDDMLIKQNDIFFCKYCNFVFNLHFIQWFATYLIHI